MSSKKFESTLFLSDWEIETDSGYKPLKNISKTIQYDVWYIRTVSHELYCADDHIVFDNNNNQIYVKDLKVGMSIQTDSGIETILCIYKTDRIENMYDTEVDSIDHTYYSNGIKSHNTTITVCFLLWYVLFHSHKAIAVLANKGSSAMDIVGRIETAYINLPKWMQQGVNVWNKGSFSLENGSSVTSAATSSDAVRGRSYSCIFIDECAFIPKNIWNKFFTSTWPTISSGKETRSIVVSTPNGQNHFYNFWIRAKEGKNNFYPMEVNWWDVPGRDEKWKEEQLGTMTEEQFQTEYGNSFTASANTLVLPDYFPRLEKNIQVPIQFTDTVKIFEKPIKDHIYFATVDCASVGNDYSTISIIDITSFPYIQVASFADNIISDISFPQVIMELCIKYNNAQVLVESNEIGTAILNILNYDLEYEYIIRTYTASSVRLGQRTTIRTKNLGCLRLKDMIETNKLIIKDIKTLDELRHFVLSGKSYAAESGYHDDLIMGLVNFAYYASTPEFRLHYDDNFTDEYRKEFEQKIMEDLSPLPIFGSSMDDNIDKEDLRWLKS